MRTSRPRSELVRLTRAGILIAIGIAPAFLGCVDSDDCSLADCQDEVRANLPVRFGVAPYNVEICRNGVCAVGTIDPGRTPTTALSAGSFVASVAVVPFDGGVPPTVFHLSVVLLLRDTARNGDRYRFVVTDSEGAPSFDAERIVEYEAQSVNGPGCGPVCQHADLDFGE